MSSGVLMTDLPAGRRCKPLESTMKCDTNCPLLHVEGRRYVANRETFDR